jgi:hypothetical protein
MLRNPLRGSACAGLTLLFFGLPSLATAGSVSSLGLPLDLTSVGSGNVMTLLTVQANGIETGSVTWNGSTDVRTGNATPDSFTRTVAELRGLGINGSSFGLVFSGSESAVSPSVTLPGFSLRFFSADGTRLFDVAYTTGPSGQSIPGFGPSGQTGWLYQVSLSDAEADLFYASDANRVGVLLNGGIGGASDGSESLALLHLELMCGPGPDGQVPEPGSVLVWLLASAGVWTVRRGRRTAAAAKS